MKNLLLLLLLVAGAWYLFSDKEAPPAPAVEQAAPPPPRVDYSGVKTFYSPLNDPPISASGNHFTGSAVNLGDGSTAQPVSVAPGPVTAAPAPATDRATSSIGLGGGGNH